MSELPTNDAPLAHEGGKVGAANSGDMAPDRVPQNMPSRDCVSTAEFIAALRRDEVERRREELASKVLLPDAEFRARLGMSPQALSRAVKAGRMYSLRGPSDELVYPAFFTEQSPGRAALERVCETLGDLPEVHKHFFLTSTRTSLGNISPLQALARGKEDEALAAAVAFRQM